MSGEADAYTDLVGAQLPTNSEEEYEERTKVDKGPLDVRDDRLWEDQEYSNAEKEKGY